MSEIVEKVHPKSHIYLESDSEDDSTQTSFQYHVFDLETDSESDSEENYHKKKKNQYGGRYKYPFGFRNSKKVMNKKIRPRISKLRNPSQAIRPFKLTQSKLLKIKATKNT